LTKDSRLYQHYFWRQKGGRILILWWLDCHLSMSSMTVTTTFIVSISTLGLGLGLLVEKTGISGENHQPVASQCQLYQIKNVASNTPLHEWGSNSYI
jgi:hypothetical protein